MYIDLTQLNVLAILVSIISNMIIGAFWYSNLLFGKIWLKLIGKKVEDISKKDSNKSMSLSIIPAILAIITLSTTLLMTNITTIGGGLFLASLISIGFIGTSAFNLVLFEGRGVRLTLINWGYAFVSLNIASIILVLWK